MYLDEEHNHRHHVEGTLRQVKHFEVPGVVELGILQPHVVQGESDVASDDSDPCGEGEEVVEHQPRLLLGCEAGGKPTSHLCSIWGWEGELRIPMVFARRRKSVLDKK